MNYLDIFNSTNLTPDESDRLKAWMMKGGVTPDKYEGVDFYWCEALGKEINGLFTGIMSNRVFLTPCFKSQLERLAATAAHELVHRRDFKKNPIMYFFRKLPFLRAIVLEKEAEEVEKEVNEKLGIDEASRL